MQVLRNAPRVIEIDKIVVLDLPEYRKQRQREKKTD
jgi:hypothetical protein